MVLPKLRFKSNPPTSNDIRSEHWIGLRGPLLFVMNDERVLGAENHVNSRNVHNCPCQLFMLWIIVLFNSIRVSINLFTHTFVKSNHHNLCNFSGLINKLNFRSFVIFFWFLWFRLYRRRFPIFNPDAIISFTRVLKLVTGYIWSKADLDWWIHLLIVRLIFSLLALKRQTLICCLRRTIISWTT